MSHIAIAKQLIKQHEGLRLTVYSDSLGNPTIGYGRELARRGINETEARILLDRDIAEHWAELAHAFPVVHTLLPARQAALLDMAYNLGVPGLARFRRMWDAIHAGDWPQAAREALDSRWAGQVGGRAKRIAEILKTGVLA